MKGKKGVIEYIGAGVVVIIVLIGGLFIMVGDKLSATGYVINNNDINYVGNINNNKVCSILNYDYSNIPRESRIFFTDIQTAINKGFTYSENCD